MLKDFLALIFRKTPRGIRRLVSRTIHPQFTASAGAVVVDDQGRVLLLNHVFRAGSGWGIPGGFIEAAEQPEEALRRELLEEVGLEVTNIEFAFVRTIGNAKQIEIVFRCRPKGEARC
jgi:ADP-ribose pyrophosphatase YjhB (NUDIX family)